MLMMAYSGLISREMRSRARLAPRPRPDSPDSPDSQGKTSVSLRLVAVLLRLAPTGLRPEAANVRLTSTRSTTRSRAYLFGAKLVQFIKCMHIAILASQSDQCMQHQRARPSSHNSFLASRAAMVVREALSSSQCGTRRTT